jgi:hypothetical protein
MRTTLLLPLAGLLAGPIVAVVVSPLLAQPAPPYPIAQPPIGPSVGWEFEGESQLNQVKIAETEYVGDCEGFDTEVKTARFTSSQTRSGDKRRVIVRNITRGLPSDPAPYTNREYYQGRASEATKMEFGTKHSSKRFRVLPGTNEFEFEIRDRDRVIDAGRFTALIEKDTRKIDRNAQWYEEEICANSAVATNVCADIRDRRQYRCPDGRVLKSIMTPDDEPIRSLISNQTNRDISVEIDGDHYRLESGETVRLRRRSSFRVRFNPECANCQPTQSELIPIGKRVKFQNKWNNDTRIELVDDSRDESRSNYRSNYRSHH